MAVIGYISNKYTKIREICCCRVLQLPLVPGASNMILSPLIAMTKNLRMALFYHRGKDPQINLKVMKRERQVLEDR